MPGWLSKSGWAESCDGLKNMVGPAEGAVSCDVGAAPYAGVMLGTFEGCKIKDALP